ncbi:MutT/NUDIX hydrolase [Haematococcus lacustris]|uniref:MutT/NUDIX hydrolase n=1 Tax=Haematococcus lacustris TaxID=44745 RepID=A0A699ZR09_HAELA|nr:MutT/NUDIX hydrolase [Haematococcus lacustris]
MWETLEEAGAVVTITAPYCHWDIPIIGQAYVLFRAQLAPPFSFSAGPESQEVALFSPADIPHAALAFSSIAITLRLYQEDLAAGHFRLHHGVIDKRPGSGPNDPASFVVRDHMALDLQAAEGTAMQPH